ncbi:unnamed protein product [Rotaria sp. Silwood1]|nr:unnamed protein product [Rotaria sp. Silwood1]
MLMTCAGYFQSPQIQLRGRSLDPFSSIKKLAQVLNVSTPDQWDPLMNSTTTFGSYGQEKGELSTIHTAMANWSIPEQFRKQAIESVRLLLMVTAEGSFLGQAFMFDLATGSHTLKMNKIEQKAMINVLGLLAEEHGFDNIYTHSEYSR